MGLKSSFKEDLKKKVELEKKEAAFLSKAPVITKSPETEKPPIEFTKQTIVLDRTKYKKLRNYCYDNKISFQELVSSMIDKWIIDQNL